MKWKWKWISVKTAKPPCKRDPNALGTPVLIWPRRPLGSQDCIDGFCYYGRHATGRPTFYLFGAQIDNITHWQPLPNGPGRK